METKNILIGLGVAGAIGAYLYFNNKKNQTPLNNGGASSGGNTTDTTDDTTTNTGGTSGGGTSGGGTSGGGTSGTSGGGTSGGGTSGGGTSGGGTSGGGTSGGGGLTEEEILILSCNSVGGTWINSTCVYTNSPNPRGTEVAQADFDIFGGHSGSGSLGAINTNPKTGYSTNTGGTSGGSSTPNYSLEFCGLKM
jgi:hypothetical protein